jgi:zinc protease
MYLHPSFSPRKAISIKSLFLNEQKARSLSGGYFFTRDPYLFSINSSLVKAEDMQYVKDEITKVLDSAKTKKVDANYCRNESRV